MSKVMAGGSAYKRKAAPGSKAGSAWRKKQAGWPLSEPEFAIFATQFQELL
jgi:hypothetical protein